MNITYSQDSSPGQHAETAMESIPTTALTRPLRRTVSPVNPQPIQPVDHREVLRSTLTAVTAERWGHCTCWDVDAATASSCSDLRHAAARLAEETARTAALGHVADLVLSTFGRLRPADAERLVQAMRLPLPDRRRSA